MAAAATNRTSGIPGILFLLGYFMLFCASMMSLAGLWRTYAEHARESWIETPARVTKCSLNVNHPFSRDGGGTTYSLRCKLGYEFGSYEYVNALRTTSGRSDEVRSGIEQWVDEHPPGSTVQVKVNPHDPHELWVTGELPIHQFNTSSEAWITALAFGVPGFLMIAFTWKRIPSLRRNPSVAHS